nr:beta-1,4-galactosyltransferase 1 isoform X2 [Odocoileus virginianus texanus]
MLHQTCPPCVPPFPPLAAFFLATVEVPPLSSAKAWRGAVLPSPSRLLPSRVVLSSAGRGVFACVRALPAPAALRCTSLRPDSLVSLTTRLRAPSATRLGCGARTASCGSTSSQDRTPCSWLSGKERERNADLTAAATAAATDATLAGESMFNRAKLLNVGFKEALEDYDYNCFVFSDVDLIPMNDHNTYRCFSQPRHISVAMDKFGFSLPYVQYFGGVSALSKQQFLSINGFPNNYWGWGGEDDDIYNRLAFRGMSVSRPNAVVGKCRMIRHSRDKKNEPNPQRFDRIAHTKETMLSDGLNSLTYTVLEVQRYPLYTKITVDIGTPS